MAVMAVVSGSSNYVIVGVAIVIYGLWYAIRQWSSRHVHRREPPLIPYWIPGVGHTLSFLRNTDKTIENAIPYLDSEDGTFRLQVGGQSLYVVQDVRLISEVHKHTKSMGNNHFLDTMMAASGIPGPTRAHLWSSFTATRKVPIPRSITQNIRRALRARPQSNPLTLNILAQMDRTLTPLAASDPLRRSITEPDEVSLFEWIVDAFIVTISDGAMGKVCLDMFPEVVDNMFRLQTNIYAIFTRRPRILAPKAYAACDKLTQILAKYFALPREAKIGCAEFVTMAEDEIRSAAVSEEELAKMFVWIYWGMLDNPSTIAFWLLCRILHNPGLLSVIRKECEESFLRNSPITPADIPARLECCPILKATFEETMRIHSGPHVFRHVSEDTEIGPYLLRKGSTLLIPYNRLQMSKSHWGLDAEEFKYQRFLDNPGLANSRYYKPFSDGIHQCGGVAMAPQLVMYFIAIVLCRYDVDVLGWIGNHPFPRLDTSKGRATVPMPVAGDVPHVTITPRKRAA